MSEPRVIRDHPWLPDGEVWLYESEPTPWPADLFRTIRCPGCDRDVYASLWPDPDSHWSFCTIAHPPMPPLNLGGLVSGL